MDKENKLLKDCYMNYDVIDRNNISLITVDQVMHAELLITLLCDCSYVYVETENHHLTGIISRGDFQKLFMAGKHVNTRYCSLRLETGMEQLADKIYKEKGIKEIPVLSNDGELLYVLRRKKNLILSFDFDWNLCDNFCIKSFFATAQNIYYLRDSQKIRGLRDKAFSFLKIIKINNVLGIRENDILICDWDGINNKIKRYSIEEVYLTILAMSAIKYFSSKGIRYYFFQSPIEKKLRKEKMFFLKKERDSWEEEDLLPFYEDYVKEMKYWLSKDYKNVEFGEIDKKYLLIDVKSDTYNVVDNQRSTSFQPDDYEHTIWIMGTCIVRGYGVSDEMTIPSILQKKIMRKGYNKYIVRNLGTGGGYEFLF